MGGTPDGVGGVLKRSLAGATQPHRKSAAANPEFARTLPLAFAKAMTKLGERSKAYPLVVEDTQLQTILGEEMTQMRDGKKSARDAAAAVKQRFGPLLATRI